MNSFVANVIQYGFWFPVCHQSFCKGRKMEKDLIPLSCYANCIRNIGEKQSVNLTAEKSKPVFYWEKMGIYWGWTQLTLAKANSDLFWVLKNRNIKVICKNLNLKFIWEACNRQNRMRGRSCKRNLEKFSTYISHEQGPGQGAACDIKQWWDALEENGSKGQSSGKVYVSAVPSRDWFVFFYLTACH